jgi:hypothetical protein
MFIGNGPMRLAMSDSLRDTDYVGAAQLMQDVLAPLSETDDSRPLHLFPPSCRQNRILQSSRPRAKEQQRYGRPEDTEGAKQADLVERLPPKNPRAFNARYAMASSALDR